MTWPYAFFRMSGRFFALHLAIRFVFIPKVL